MIRYNCPHCGAALEAQDSLSGQDQTCPVCQQRTIVPVPTTRVAGPPPIGPVGKSRQVPQIIMIPLLVSAIWNCAAAVGYFFTCIGVVIAVPLIILAIYEFKLYADLTNQQQIVDPARVRKIAICEIIAGLVSLVPLVAGIIILTNLPSVDINKGKSSQQQTSWQ